MLEFHSEQFGGDLVLLERFDSGGMAEVYRAKQLGSGGFEKIVAVKRILPHLAADPLFLQTFQLEMNLIAKLQHPNIVQVFRNGEAQGYPFLVMEFMIGVNLLTLINAAARRGVRIPPEHACYIALCLTRALDYAHTFQDPVTGAQHVIVHRDVNVKNIMLSYGGEVKLVDFGIAKLISGSTTTLTRTGTIRGTLPYCSPEQLHGLELDGRSDMFSLGAVIWELLAGRRLFQGETEFEIMRQIIDEPAPSLAQIGGIPPDLDRIVQRMLEKDRNDRFASDNDLFRELNLFSNRNFPEFTPADAVDLINLLIPVETRAGSRGLIRQAADTGGAATTVQTVVFQYVRPAVVALLACIIAAFGVVYWMLGRDPSDSTRVEGLPAQIHGLTAWFEARNYQFDSGGGASIWRNNIGTAEARQDESAARPAFKPAVPGDVPWVEFDGKQQFLIADSLANTFVGSEGLTLVAVPKLRGYQDSYLFALQGEDVLEDLLRVGFAADGGLRVKSESMMEQFRESEPGLVPTGKLFVLTALVARDYGAAYVNGKEVFSWVIPDPVAYWQVKRVSIGQEWDRTTPSDFYSGRLTELLIYDRPLDQAQISSIHDYLLKKYRVN